MNGAVNRDYDELLRRALHAAADSVEPSADGLERIRERLGHPPLLSFSSIAGWYSVAVVRFTGWAVPAFGTACEIFWALVDRFRPLDTPPGHAKPGLRWLRPVTATALAIFVVAGGGLAAEVIPGAISAAPAGDSGPGGGIGGPGGATGQGAVHGSSPFQRHPGFARATPHGPVTRARAGGQQVPPGQQLGLADDQYRRSGAPDSSVADQHQHLAGPDVDQSRGRPRPARRPPPAAPRRASPARAPRARRAPRPAARTRPTPARAGQSAPARPARAPPRWRQGTALPGADRRPRGLVHRPVSVVLADQQVDPQGGAAHAGPAASPTWSIHTPAGPGGSRCPPAGAGTRSNQIAQST